MFVSLLVRRLRPGKTYQDFLEAWYPDHGFGIPVRGPIVARNLEDEREILALAFLDVGRDELAHGLSRIAEQEGTRHRRIDAVIESTSVRGIYEVAAELDFSTDATVAASRPPGLRRRARPRDDRGSAG